MRIRSTFILNSLISSSVLAFDISVHVDPISQATLRHWYTGQTFGDCDSNNFENHGDYDQWISHISNKEESLVWMKELGVNILSICQPDNMIQNYYLDPALDGMQLINYWYPDKAFRYTEAQDFRMITAENAEDGWYSIGKLHDSTVSVIRNRDIDSLRNGFDPILRIDESATSNNDTLMWWTNYLVPVDGWDRQTGTTYWPDAEATMPMHFYVTCDMELGSCDTNTTQGRCVATLEFFVRWWGREGLERHLGSCTDTIKWVKFSVPISTRDFVDSSGFETVHKRIDPATTRLTLVNSDQETLFSEMGCSPTESDTSWPRYQFWDNFEADVHVRYEGCHTFYLYSVEIQDEAYYLLHSAPESVRDSVATALADSFAAQRDRSGGKIVGWYTDEGVASTRKSFVTVNKFLQDRGLPTFYVNAYNSNSTYNGEGDRMIREANAQDVQFEVYMSETYVFKPDSTCIPTIAPQPITWCFTDSATDRSYLEYEEMTESCPREFCTLWSDSTHFTRYKATKSLQAALDALVWGYDLFYASDGGITAYQPYPINPASQRGFRGQLQQVDHFHQYGVKYWSMLIGGTEGDSIDTDSCVTQYDNWGQLHRGRLPTPNEIKLECWLAVACDADGILWYPWEMGGLLGNDISGGGWCHDLGVEIVKTDRYNAAKQVCNEIHEIAPTLEALEFVRTTGSRVLERSYSEGNFPDSLRLYLDSYLNYGGTDYQTMVRNIYAQKWDSVDQQWAGGGASYAQVSYWKGVSQGTADFWFLVVNRRALENETRRVTVEIGALDSSYSYTVHYQLADSYAVSQRYDEGNHEPYEGVFRQKFEVILEPGEAELVHFFVMDTTDLVLQDTVTLTAPAYYNRNVILDNAHVTIVPDTAAQRYQVIKGEQTVQAWKDSLVILFAPGKGIKLTGSGAGQSTLRIVGNDTTQIILKCSKGGNFKWTGITSTSNDVESSVYLRNVTVANAKYGLHRISSAGVDSLVNCKFLANAVGVFSRGPRPIVANGCEFDQNGIGISLFSGAILRMQNSSLSKSKSQGIFASINSTVNLDNVVVTGSTIDESQGGIRSIGADLWLKCCKISENRGIGVEAIGGTFAAADLDTSSARFGANQLFNNWQQELVLDGPINVWLKNGYNQFYDSKYLGRNRTWIRFDNLSASSFDWHGNYWGGVDEEDIERYIDFTRGDTILRPTWLPALQSQPEFCELPFPTLEELPCVANGVVAELEPDYSTAAGLYQSALLDSSAICRKVSTITRLLSANSLDGVSPSVSATLLNSILDTTTSPELRHAASLGLAMVLSESLGETDSAKAIFDQVIESAGDDIYSKIDGQLGKLTVELREEEADTVDGLTVEELSAYMDSVDQILGQRFVWTQYEITDSVVMYAPIRVDSVINVRGGGVLTILPHPGYKNPVVEFADRGAIKVYGTDTTMAKGKLYVYGEPDSRVKLHWEDSTGTRNVFSERGFVKIKNADFYGNGFVNQTQDLQGSYSGLRRATFQADSCTFEWFDEGVMVRATDTTSYMRACTLSHMGGNAAMYSGFGAGLVIYKADGFTVEDCVFDANDGVGIYHGYANNVLIRNCVITGGAKAGVYGASSAGGSARLECCTVESNGDSLPELWTLGVAYDLVGGHNSFADSTGPLIKSSDPAYVDLENGENMFNLWGIGKYVQSGDTNDTWDITWNTWSPSSPGDQDFYDYLWPHNSNKWTVDSSLADFVSCGESSTSSIGGGNWLIVDPTATTSGTMSTTEDDIDINTSISQNTSLETKLSSAKSSVKARTNPHERKVGIFTSEMRKLAKADLVASHHRELAEWRSVKAGSSKGGRDVAIKFVNDNSRSEFVPAALGYIAGSARTGDVGYTASQYLGDFAIETKDQSVKLLAQRLSFQAMALEGKPGPALQGLEDMLEDATMGRDSAMALLAAMQIYCDYSQTGELEPRYRQVIVADHFDLVRKSLYLSEQLDNLDSDNGKSGAPIPLAYSLYQNYPNPFNPNTEIRFDLPEAIRVELRVFNILGQEVVTLVDDVRAAGAYKILWDGKNAGGLSVASGVYVYQLKTGNFQDAKKMVLIR